MAPSEIYALVVLRGTSDRTFSIHSVWYDPVYAADLAESMNESREEYEFVEYAVRRWDVEDAYLNE